MIVPGSSFHRGTRFNILRFTRVVCFQGRKEKKNMVYKVYSGRTGGVFGELITVEVDVSPGLPGIEIIGLPGSDVREAKDRVRVALTNVGITIPSVKIVINLSPADEHKNGSAFDLPIAVAILGALGHIEPFKAENTLVLGELSLDGSITRARGVLPIVRMAKERGFNRVILPSDNAKEASLIRGINIIPVDNLGMLMAYLLLPEEMASIQIAPFVNDEFEKFLSEDELSEDFKDVKGQESVKRAAGIAAAGFHNLLLTGPPGTGKSLIAKRIPYIMPKLSYEESLEVTAIYSVAGKLDEEHPFIKERPFWSPHHGASSQSIVGGGPKAMPGLVSLSHRGILFLDELAEFKRETLDMLRQPLEDGKITVSRMGGVYTYPSKFMLVGATNPCPCGYYPDRNRCSCTQAQINRYMSKISGPIIDRIDICVEVSRLEMGEIKCEETGLTSEELRYGVERAVEAQKKRYRDEVFKFNSQIPTQLIEKYIPLDKDAEEYLYSAYEGMNMSMRSFYKLIKVARTIADFDGDEEVMIKHLAEACCYRFPVGLGG